MTADDLARLRATLTLSPKVELHPIDVAVTDACTAISRDVLADPWDRFIVATAKALGLPLVTRDRAVAQANLVDTIW